MKGHFLRLYQYNQWANKLFCDTISNSDHQNSKIDVLLSHIYAAELIWLSRVYEVNIKIPSVWELLPLEEAIESLKKTDSIWIKYLENEPDFDSVISYSDSTGNAHQTVLKDIITHVANHGTHHRGQMATLLRLENMDPPASDFIFFTRED